MGSLSSSFLLKPFLLGILGGLGVAREAAGGQAGHRVTHPKIFGSSIPGSSSPKTWVGVKFWAGL